MRKTSGLAGGLLMLIMLAAFSAPTPALAVMLVEESTAPQHPKGAKLDDEAVLDVPRDTRVVLILIQNGQTYVVNGPHKGTLAAYRKTRSTWWRRVLGRFWSGSGGGEAQTPGGVRSVAPK